MKIIVVGAGAAGIMAARELTRAGHDVIVLEARDRIGGRIFPQSVEEFGYEAMGGAEFIHGAAPITRGIIKEAGLTLQQGTEWWNVYDGEPSTRNIWEGSMPQLEQRLDELEADMTVADFLDTYFPAPGHDEVREFATRWTQSYDAGEITRASAKSMGHEMIHDREHSQYSLKEGYGALLAHLMKDIKAEIRLSEPVRRIDFSGEHVQVFTDTEVYEAEKVLVTVPLPLISSIEYIPAISEKLHAATKIGFGSVIKVLIRFDHKWWGSLREKQFEKLFFMFSKEIIPTWWTQYPAEHAVLTGWVAGPSAHALRQKSEAEIISLALESLSNIFTVDLARLREMTVASRAFIWDADPYSQGGYSYPTPETETAIEDIITPVNDKLYFAGEALWDEQCATVEGAFQSGCAAAARMMQ